MVVSMGKVSCIFEVIFAASDAWMDIRERWWRGWLLDSGGILASGDFTAL
jgi:hypothetical protein